MGKKKKDASEVFTPEGMWFQKIYCFKGGPTKHNSERHLFSIFDHPVNGQSLAFIIEPTGNSDRLTVFDPFNFTSYSVKRDAGELKDYEPIIMNETRRLQLVKQVTDKWALRCKLNLKSDFDTAGLVLKRLNGEIPEIRPKRIEERVKENGEKKRGGKEAAKKILKPLPTKGKRFDVLEHFKAGKSIREAMAEFGMSRSTVLTHLYRLNKDHGIGYDLVGEKATLTIPKK